MLLVVERGRVMPALGGSFYSRLKIVVGSSALRFAWLSADGVVITGPFRMSIMIESATRREWFHRLRVGVPQVLTGSRVVFGGPP